mmetsp:Transcript_221/g.316  ORF Transcript_221/g.316 Transcript_221/m.316 type:complete len:224 (+) Transcript_221:604-1275(+)
MMARKIAVNSFSSLAFSAARVSMKYKLQSPREHPVMTPTTLPKVDAARVTRMSCWVGDSCGIVKPMRSTTSSMVLPNNTPLVSLNICPIAAAASEDKPKATPTELSMASPAYIKTVLSTKPNAINGTMLNAKIFCRSWAEGAPPPAPRAASLPAALLGPALAATPLWVAVVAVDRPRRMTEVLPGIPFWTPFPFATRALRANRVVAPCHRPWPAAEATAAVEE